MPMSKNFKTMKTTKMSLANIQGKMSRAEMKKIMAGSESSCAATACAGHGSGTCHTAVRNNTPGCYCTVAEGDNDC